MTEVRPLSEVLREMPDRRSAQGRRHPLDAMLALACAAMLCGYRSYGAIAEWGRRYDPALVRALGFTPTPTPCAATFYLAFRALDRPRLAGLLGAWAEPVLAATAPPNLTPAARSVPPTRWRWMARRCAAVAGLVVEGRVVTMDALLTQRAIAEAIRAAGGDSVMVVTGNQRQRQADSAAAFGSPPAACDPPWTTADTHDHGHGRDEHRRLSASAALTDYLDWTGVAQVFRLDRTVTTCRSAAVRQETVFGLTSLPPDRGRAAHRLGYVRGPWRSEN